MADSTELPATARAHKDRRVFVALLAMYSLILLPILRADRYCDDDLKRALFGRTGWDSNGRPFTTFLMKLLQAYNHALVDISPLTQIGAIAILAWAGVLIARRYAVRSYWMAALVAFPLGAQPFYLENLSFKFDSLSMSLAILLALLPVLALKNDRKGWWLGVVSLIGSLGLYQAAINVYLIFVLLDVVLAQLHDKPPRELVSQLFTRVLQAGLGMLIYELLIGIHISGWVKQRSATIRGLGEIPQIKANLAEYFRFVVGSFNTHWWMYITPVLIVLACFPVAIGIRYAIRSRPSQPIWISTVLFATSLILPMAAIACILGPMLMLVDPPIFPRLLMGVGAILTAALVVMHATLRQWRRSDKWTMSVAGMLAIGMCSIAGAYGNAAGDQKNYEERIAARLADDLGELGATNVIHYYLVDGSAGYSPMTAHVAEQFPIVHSLVPSYIDGDNLFFTHLFFSYYMAGVKSLNTDDVQNMKRIPAILAKACTVAVSRNTGTYSLRLVDDVAVVTFHAGHPFRCADIPRLGSGTVPTPQTERAARDAELP